MEERSELLRKAEKPLHVSDRAASARERLEAREATLHYARLAKAGVGIATLYGLLFPCLLLWTLSTHGFQWSDQPAALAWTLTTVADYIGVALASGILITAYESYPLKRQAALGSGSSLLFFADSASSSRPTRPRGWLWFWLSLFFQCPALLAYAPVFPSSSRGSPLRLGPFSTLGLILLRVSFLLAFVGLSIWAWYGNGLMNLGSLVGAQTWLLVWVVNFYGAVAALFSILMTASRSRAVPAAACLVGCLAGCPVFLFYVGFVVWSMQGEASEDCARAVLDSTSAVG